MPLLKQGQMEVLKKYVIGLGQLSAQKDETEFGNNYIGNSNWIANSMCFISVSGLLDIDSMLIDKLSSAFTKAYKAQRNEMRQYCSICACSCAGTICSDCATERDLELGE